MKKTSVVVTNETEEAVIEKAWRDHRVRSWQGAMDLAIQRFLDSAPVQPATGPAPVPSGMRAILVPATLPDEDAALLEMAGSELARLAERERKDFADQAEHQRSRIKAIEPVEMQLKRRKAR